MKLPYRIFLYTLLTAVILIACSSPNAEQTEPQLSPESLASEELPEFPEQSIEEPLTRWNQATQIDEQGEVAVEVTPLNWNTQDGIVEFEVSLNTHSVDLSMDLAQLTILTTDAGIEVQAIRWDAPLGGHHVSGKLIFPSAVDGMSILDGATKITLQLLDVDAPLRTFEWQLE